MYIFKNISIKRVTVYAIISIVLIIIMVGLTYKYISHTVYPALTFLFSLLISIYIGKKILQEQTIIEITENSMTINNNTAIDLKICVANQHYKITGNEEIEIKNTELV